MSESIPGSLVALAGVAILAFLAARRLALLASRKLAGTLAVLCLLGAAATIFTVDVNLPLADSHLRPSGDPAPVWLALLAWMFRLVPVLIPVALLLRRVKERRGAA